MTPERLQEIRDRLPLRPYVTSTVNGTDASINGIPPGRCRMCADGSPGCIEGELSPLFRWHKRHIPYLRQEHRDIRDLLAEVDRMRDDLAVAQGEAWTCQECFAVHPLSRKPIYGEYPEEGDVFCSEACLHANDARGDEACDPGVQP